MENVSGSSSRSQLSGSSMNNLMIYIFEEKKTLNEIQNYRQGMGIEKKKKPSGIGDGDSAGSSVLKLPGA